MKTPFDAMLMLPPYCVANITEMLATGIAQTTVIIPKRVASFQKTPIRRYINTGRAICFNTAKG